jgi:hypothetical protein
MKLYATPGGQWAGTEKDWIAKMKVEGYNPKTYDGRKQVEVPTDKPKLLEFLTFYSVNVINPGTHPVVEAAGGEPRPPADLPAATPSLEELRAIHNPEEYAPSAPLTMIVEQVPTTVSTLPDLFRAAPIPVQVELAVNLLDRLNAQVTNTTR